MRRLVRDKRGNVAIIMALGAMSLVASAAVAVDSGSIFLASRRVQGAADLAALSAATNMSVANATQTAHSNLDRSNLGKAIKVDVKFGRYTADPTLTPADRFKSDPDPDAARVTLQSQAPLFFGAMILGKPSVSVQRTATAAQAKLGAFRLGTRLAALNGGVANAVLSGLTGSTISLSVMDYNALASTDISLFQFMDAMRTNMRITTASYDTLLQSDVKASDALTAMAVVLAAAQHASEARTVSRIAVATGDDKKLQIGKLIDLGPYAPQDKAAQPLDMSVSAYSLVDMVLQASNVERQIELSIPNAGVPGLGQITAWLGIGEPQTGAAWLSVGPPGKAQVRTAQARLYIDAKVLGAANPLGGTLPLRLPVLVELASAEARLSDVRCASRASDRSMSVDVLPSVGTVRIGDMNLNDLTNFNRVPTASPATVLSLPIVRVRASSVVNVGGNDWSTLTFSGDDITDHRTKTVSSHGFVGGLASSVASHMTLDASALGLSLTPVTKTITMTTGAALSAAAPLLDPVIDSLLSAAGLSLGEADVQPAGVRCMPAVLVG